MTSAYTAYTTMEGGDAALEQRNALVLQELPQVYFIASRILERLPPHVELEDLVSAGVVGLLKACQSFDSTKDVQFKTFAKFRIRGAILDSLRELDWGSRGLRRKGREITEATSKLEGTLGRQPGKEEIAKEMNLSTEQLDNAMTQLQGLRIMGQQTASSNGEGEYDVIESAASSWENPFELYCKGEQKARLVAAVADLPEREQLILSLLYVEEMTTKEVGLVIGIAISRVSQIHHAALAKLKLALAHPKSLRAISPALQARGGAATSIEKPVERDCSHGRAAPLNLVALAAYQAQRGHRSGKTDGVLT